VGEVVTGFQLRAGRALVGWSRGDLSRAAGLNRNSVARWEGCLDIPAKSRIEPYAVGRMRNALERAGVYLFADPAPGAMYGRQKG